MGIGRCPVALGMVLDRLVEMAEGNLEPLLAQEVMDLIICGRKIEGFWKGAVQLSIDDLEAISFQGSGKFWKPLLKCLRGPEGVEAGAFGTLGSTLDEIAHDRIGQVGSLVRLGIRVVEQVADEAVRAVPL